MPSEVTARLGRSLKKYGIVFSFLLIVVVLTITSPVFLRIANIINIFRQVSIVGIVSMGMALVIIMGGIDLSVGSGLALTGVMTALVSKQLGLPIALSFLVGIGVGGAVGLFNGVIIAKGKIAPFIVTLGTMTITRGAAFILAKGMPIAGLGDEFGRVGGGDIASVPTPVVIYLLVIALSTFILSQTTLGRHIYAIGGNEVAAVASGIAIDRVKIINYAMLGLLTGLAGALLASRIRSGQPSVGVGYELDAIAACIIGGVSFSGGVGTAVGAFLGTLIIGVINNGLDLLNVQTFYQQIVKGTIIIVTVLADRRRTR